MPRPLSPWVAVALLAAAPLRADENLTRVVLSGESPGAARRLESARKLARAGQLAEAVDEYQRLLEEAGDKLAPVDERASVQVRWLCHLDLAALPPEGRRLYRNRVDAQARRWFEQGAATRDVPLLRRVVDEAFCSRDGDRALDLLGDLAFERGRFVEAERWWRRLSPNVRDAKARPGLDLVYPDPRGDPARARAKQVLAQLFRPESGVSTAALRDALDDYRRHYPDAAGPLAGRTGTYADTLQALLEKRAALAPAAAGWTSFGGGPARDRVLPAEPSDPNRLARLVRRWRVNLETHLRYDADDPARDRAPSARAARALAFHPLLVDGRVLVADARTVTAYDLRTGHADVWYDGAGANAGINADVSLPAHADPRYTLTVADGCVLARLGVQCIGPERRPDESGSVLVCLGLKPDARGERLRWLARPEANPREVPVFEGAPVAADGRVYVAVTRFVGGRTVTAVHCYPLRAEGAPPLRWRQDVCETPELGGKDERCRHPLLTLAGPNVVYCSHSGAIAALDAVTGRHVWARRYPGRAPGADDPPSPRDLTPPVYAGGRLYVAPADCDRLLCLDPATGQLLWERDQVEVVHLLGVSRGRLIFTTPQGIRAVDAATGSDRGGWAEPDVNTLPPFGRGFLAGDLVFWPTRGRLYVLSAEDGQQPDDLHPGPWQDVPPGNLVYGDGCLAVAGNTILSVYVPRAWLRAEREEEVRARPRSAVAYYELALAEADAGRDTEALAALDRTEQLAEPGECWQRESLRQLARDLRRRLTGDRVPRPVRPGTEPLPRQPESRRAAPAAPPDLPLPLLHAWQVALAPGEHFLPAHVAGAPPSVVPDDLAPGPLLFALGRQLVCREPAAGAVRWRRSLPFAPDWAGRHADTVVAAGTGGVGCLRLDDGAVLGSYLPPGRQPLGDFRLTATRLFCLQEEHRLVALDPQTGRVEWTVAAPSAGLGLPYPSGRFRAYQAGPAWVVAQTAGGKLWVLDGQTGRRAHQLDTTRDPWPRPPLALDRQHFCLVTDPWTVVLLDAAAGKDLARPALVAPTTLSGRPPLAVGAGDVLLLVVDRNFGPTLQRFDPLTGQPLWPEKRLLGTDPVADGAVVFDREAVYAVSGNALFAHALADGRALWRVALPAEGRDWRTLRTRDYLVAYPADAGGFDLACRSPFGSLALTGTVPSPRGGTADIPVLFCDPMTGRLVQRLNLPAAPPALAWAPPRLGGPLIPELRLDRPRLVLQASGQGLAASGIGMASGRD